MRSAIPKLHHISPQWHIAQFTDDGSKRGRLWAHNKKTGRLLRTSPRSVLARTGFYRDPLTATDVSKYEDWLATHEHSVSDDVKAVGTGVGTLHDIDLGRVLHFVAVQMMRHPRAGLLGESAAGASGLFLWAISGFKVLPFDDINPMDVGKSMTLRMMEPLSEFLARYLAVFKWGLLRTDARSRGFVLSDAPVAVRTKFGGSWVGLFDDEATLYVPLSWSTCLIGVRTGRRRHVKVGPRVVADVNGLLVEGAELIVCSRFESFFWYDSKDQWRVGIQSL